MNSVRCFTFVALMNLALCATGCNSKMPVMEASSSGQGSASSSAEARTLNPIHQTDAQSIQPIHSDPKEKSLNGVYDMNVVCDTNPELKINKITITDTKSIIDMTFKSERFGNAGATGWIRTAAPGQNMAFYIADPETRAEYKLLNVEGIALEPAQTPLQEGQSVHFTLTFERIPNHLTKFHLIEGKSESHGPDGSLLRTWTFMNVKLL